MKENKKAKHYMSTVKVGPKGQVVIPKEIRSMFSIEPGDNLIIMADSERGIALHKQSVLQAFADAVFEGRPTDLKAEDKEHFANIIRQTEEKGEVSE